LIPVVSRSKKQIGRVNFNCILHIISAKIGLSKGKEKWNLFFISLVYKKSSKVIGAFIVYTEIYF
tara:strand:+ start:315 stop:509 length:195 start_codon:yes stop_codon:yes gene_type:complete